MKKIGLLLLLLLAILQIRAQRSGDEQGLDLSTLTHPRDSITVSRALNGWWKESMQNYEERMSWFNEAKFGCFIHWGVYSTAGGIWNGKKIGRYAEHLMRAARIPLETYKEKLILPFDPVAFDADEWMHNAKAAGMEYFVITAKHHDGFALFPSNAYPFDIRLTKLQRDPMKELADAARRYNIKFGFYYSHAFDWEHPDAPGNDWDYNNPGGDKLLGGRDWWLKNPTFVHNSANYLNKKAIPQIIELIQNYKPDILWFDTPHKIPLYQNLDVLQAIRQSNSTMNIVVNGRLARFADKQFGDYENTGDRSNFFYPVNGYWETIPTTNESYGFSYVDTYRKPVKYFIKLLADASSKGGNVLMNVGPKGDGSWDEPDVKLFSQIGAWLRDNGESIYGTTNSNLPVQPWGVTTQKGNKLYLHVYNWPSNGKLILGGLKNDVDQIYFLTDKKQVRVRRMNASDIELTVPSTAPDSVSTVIVVKYNSRSEDINPYRLLENDRTNDLFAFDAELIGKGLGYGDGKSIGSIRQNYVHNWTQTSQSVQWKIRLNKEEEFDIYMDYGTVGKTDAGTMKLTVGKEVFEFNYTPRPNYGRYNEMLYIGRIKLSPQIYMMHLEGKSFIGKEFMQPMFIRLSPVNR